MTLTEARALALRFLDDPTGARFNVDGAFTAIDGALKNALSKCLSDYVENGGDQFLEETTVTTSAADGTVALTSLGPIDVRSVLYAITSTSWGKIRPIRRHDRERADLVARSLVVSYVRELALPTNAAHPLVGNGATEAKSWPAFDTWIVARAALELGVTDKDLRPGLIAVEADNRESAMKRHRIPRSGDFPGVRGEVLTADLRWTYLKSTSTLQLVRVL